MEFRYRSLKQQLVAMTSWLRSVQTENDGQTVIINALDLRIYRRVAIVLTLCLGSFTISHMRDA